MAKVPCSVHPDEVAIFYCLNCDSHQNACLLCIEVNGRHRKHDLCCLDERVQRKVAESLLESTEQEKLAAIESFHRTNTFNEQVQQSLLQPLQQLDDSVEKLVRDLRDVKVAVTTAVLRAAQTARSQSIRGTDLAQLVQAVRRTTRWVSKTRLSLKVKDAGLSNLSNLVAQASSLHAEATELQQAMQMAEVDFNSITVNTAVESRVSDELSALTEPVDSLLQLSNDLVGLKPPKKSAKAADTTEELQSQTSNAELFQTAVLAPCDHSTTESESPASNNAEPAEALAATIPASAAASNAAWATNQPSTRRGAQTLQLNKQLLFVAGGNLKPETFAYDTSSDTWAQVKPLSCERGGTAATLWNGKMVVAGGWNQKDKWLNTVEQFDPESNCWTALPPMLHRRNNLGLVTFDNSLFAIGGWDGTNDLDSVEQYNSNTRQWQPVSSLKVARRGLCCAVLGVGILAAGGFDGSKRLGACEVLESAEAKWKFVASLVTARSHAAAATLNDKVYVFGGRDKDKKDLDSVEQYDCVADKWTLLPTQLSKPRWALAAATVDERIYVCGGAVGLAKADESGVLRVTAVNTVDCFDAGVTQVKCVKTLPNNLHGAAALCLPVPDKLWNQLFK